MLDSSTVVTRKLYYEDAYLREFEAEILSANDNDIVLDATAFFPEEGGQSPDRGVLAGREVLDVQIIDGYIHHFLGRKVFGASAEEIAEGLRVNGRIDWKHRFSNMQQHSGEHIFSGLIHKQFGYENIGFHLGEETVTLDFSGPLSEEDLLKTELLANEHIWRNSETIITYPSEEELASLEFRSKKELHGNVRIVTFPGADVCACCGTHVTRAGEIGLIKVLSYQNRKNGTRVDIVCGKRALNYVRDIYSENMKISHLLSANVKETSAAVERTLHELGVLRGERHRAALTALEAEKAALHSGQPFAILFTEGIDTRDLRSFCNQIIEEKEIGTCAAFSKREDGYQYVILSHSADLRPVGKALNRAFSGRGGGPAEMIQGALTGNEADIRAFLEDQF